MMRLALGERSTAGQMSELAWAASAAAVAVLMLLYHYRVFRAGLATQAVAPAPSPTVTLAVVRGATHEQLAALRQTLLDSAPAGVSVELVDYSSGGTSGSTA